METGKHLTIAAVLAASETSHWLRHALLTSLQRDPVDAARDAETLARLLEHRADAIIDQVVSGVAS